MRDCRLPAPMKPLPHHPGPALGSRIKIIQVAAAMLVAFVTALAPVSAQTTDNPADEAAWRLALGLKAWTTRWATWQIGSASIGARSVDVVSQLESGTRLAWVPVLALRRGRTFATTSFMQPARYELGNAEQRVNARREEFDANLGVDLLDGLSASLGIKRITQVAGGRYLWQGPVLGLSANAALEGPLSMYGTLGQGWLQLRLPVADPAGQRRLATQYTLGEWGLAWRRQGEGAEAASRHVLTFGYRVQVARTRNYALGARDGNGNADGLFGRETLRDVTEGWSFAWAYSY